MTWRPNYETVKTALLNDPEICEANRNLFAEFFAYEEYKLKRQNGLSDLDEGCGKTLYGYTVRLRNVNRWFGNKPWKDLTKEDIKRVYDGLEDGTITTKSGRPFIDRANYYNKIFKSKPFRLAGKADLAREIIQFSITPRRVVRYITEESFLALAKIVENPVHALLLWLAWDIGENIDSLLKLVKRDFRPQANPFTGEREYLVTLSAVNLKRSRQARSEPTLYAGTVQHADYVLARLAPDDPIFPLGYRSAVKFLHAAVRKTGATTMPNGDPVRWKDLRSGMACHLLRTGWTTDEVNARLGHTPHSATLDAYVNFLALDRSGPKQRMREFASKSNSAVVTPPLPAALRPIPPPASVAAGAGSSQSSATDQLMAALLRQLLASPSLRTD